MFGCGILVAAAQPRAPIVVHPFEVHRIDGVLLALKPVARHVGEHDLAKAVSPGERFPDRQFRRRQRAQIGKQQPGAFLDRIGLGLAAGLRRLGIGGVFVGLFETASGLVHEPAMIRAADAMFFDPAIGHVGAAVRTMAVDQAVTAGPIAVEHEVLAQEPHRLDRMVVKLAGAADRLPVAAQQFAHRGAGSDPGQHVVACSGEHDSTSVAIAARRTGGYSMSRGRPRGGWKTAIPAVRGPGRGISNQFERVSLSAAARFLLFYPSMSAGKHTASDRAEWYVQADHVPAFRHGLLATHPVSMKSAPIRSAIIIITSLFFVLLASAVLVGGHAAISPLLRPSAVTGNSTNNRGDIVVTHAGRDVLPAHDVRQHDRRITTGGMDRCRVRRRRWGRPPSTGFKWGAH